MDPSLDVTDEGKQKSGGGTTTSAEVKIEELHVKISAKESATATKQE